MAPDRADSADDEVPVFALVDRKLLLAADSVEEIKKAVDRLEGRAPVAAAPTASEEAGDIQVPFEFADFIESFGLGPAAADHDVERAFVAWLKEAYQNGQLDIRVDEDAQLDVTIDSAHPATNEALAWMARRAADHYRDSPEQFTDSPMQQALIKNLAISAQDARLRIQTSIPGQSIVDAFCVPGE
jgi:hypothetical protein